jgi:hypothetical protein
VAGWIWSTGCGLLPSVLGHLEDHKKAGECTSSYKDSADTDVQDLNRVLQILNAFFSHLGILESLGGNKISEK